MHSLGKKFTSIKQGIVKFNLFLATQISSISFPIKEIQKRKLSTISQICFWQHVHGTQSKPRFSKRDNHKGATNPILVSRKCSNCFRKGQEIFFHKLKHGKFTEDIKAVEIISTKTGNTTQIRSSQY